MPQLPTTFRARGLDLTTKPHKARPLPTSGAAWRKIRRWQLNREPLCRPCADQDRVTPATQVDHIDGDSANNVPDNWQSICAPCHRSKSAKEYGFQKRKRT